MYKIFADRLVDAVERYAKEIASQWYKSLKANPKTPSYHSLPEEECLPKAVFCYKNLRSMYFSEKPYQEMEDYFARYAEERHDEGIPLHECIYELILLRRHIWLFGHIQALYSRPTGPHEDIESINLKSAIVSSF